MSRVAALILACTAVATLPCCAPTHRPGGSEGASDPGPAPGQWPFAPASIRVHPLSRITTDAKGQPLAELRIECRDADGDSVRTIGTLWVRFGDQETPELEHDLGDMKVNEADWDRVTRTYRRSLALPAGFVCVPGKSLPVNVQLRLSAERTLQAAGEIPCP